MSQAPPSVRAPHAVLPRGPHQLSREQVAGSQRERLLRSFTALMAEHGHGGVRIGELVGRAGVSRSTFYEHFADKQECMLAAYEQFAAAVASAITPETDEAAPWRTFVETIIEEYLGLLQRDLTATRAFLVEMVSAGPAASQLRRQTVEGFVELLAQRHAAIRERDPSLGPLPPRAFLALALAVRELVRDLLEREQAPNLRTLAPDVTTLATAVVEGAAVAAGR